jgi:predicted transcriptional regulator
MKLQFTNGYRPRFEQISRILQFLAHDTRKKIPRKDIVDTLGIPNKQVENLTSMMTGFGLVHPRVSTITDLGRAIIENDPYFEKPETLWIIHYIVSSNPEWVVWYRIINEVLPSIDQFNVEKTSTHYFSDLATQFSKRTITEKLPKEVGAVFSSYARSELARLEILREESVGNFVRGNPVDIPSLAFLFCLLSYRDRYSPGSTALNIEKICQAENSPGRVFNLPEYTVRQILDDLHTNGLIRLEKFANLDQVRISETVTQKIVLMKIYNDKS